MTADIEFILEHDGKSWVCHNDTLTVRGETILQLDQAIQLALKKSKKYQSGSQILVFMGFDFDTIPTWLRQYHSHYFNRSVSIKL